MYSTPNNTSGKPKWWPKPVWPGAVTIATNMAGRGTDIKLGPGVKEAGGLAILGTERHDSRRWTDSCVDGPAGRVTPVLLNSSCLWKTT